jgi:hypothetical protein
MYAYVHISHNLFLVLVSGIHAVVRVAYQKTTRSQRASSTHTHTHHTHTHTHTLTRAMPCACVRAFEC